MNCYYHPTQPAVAICDDCRKGLCSQCARKYSTPICNSCNRGRMKYEKKEIVKELLVTFTFGILLAYLLKEKVFNDPFSSSRLSFIIIHYVVFTYIFAGIVAGWKTLTGFTPNILLIMPIIGWLIYFLLKLFLSFWVGLIMLPIRTIRNIVRLIQLQRVRI